MYSARPTGRRPGLRLVAVTVGLLATVSCQARPEPPWSKHLHPQLTSHSRLAARNVRA
jgi:hypothetical protein